MCPRRFVLALALVVPAACAPRLAPLTGTVVPVSMPPAALPPGHRKVIFHWVYTDDNFRLRGDGAARIAAPDSVRLDFFVTNGMGGGYAVLVGDDLRTPGGNQVQRYLPPVPLLWAALGRVRVPAAPDTIARADGDTLRVQLGGDRGWRATFVRRELRRLDLIDHGRVPQYTVRGDDGAVRYDYPQARRSLEISVVRVDTVPAFDAAIWR